MCKFLVLTNKHWEKNVPPQPTPRPNCKGPQINKLATTNSKGKQIDQALEETMDVVEKGTCSLKATSRSWNIPMTSLSNHLSKKTK